MFPLAERPFVAFVDADISELVLDDREAEAVRCVVEDVVQQGRLA